MGRERQPLRFASANHLPLQGIYVLDKNGSIVLTLGGNENLGDDIIGAAQSVLETEKYYVVLDGNLRKLAL